MAYSESVKNFNRIREYMREFYVYGFRRRGEYTQKSARSYDDEKRRMESLLGDYMKFRQTADGKTVFLSIDSRVSRHNPLYKAWKAKSFTDGDITLHFLLLDILASEERGCYLSDLTDRIYDMLPESARLFDESTIRKKLKEYVGQGIVRAEKEGKKVRYSLCEITDVSPYADILDFFSEVAPCGVIGSFLLDKVDGHDSCFTFKHHYITSAPDSEILCALFDAMREKRNVALQCVNRKTGKASEKSVVPLRVMLSVQNGRQYLMAYIPQIYRIGAFRIDHILSVKEENVNESFDLHRKQLDGMQKHIFGVSTQSHGGCRMEHVEFTVVFGDDEPYIPRRLERERRCGTVERIDKNTCRFSADVYDASELIPWIRTFLSRIGEIRFSNEATQKQFAADFDAMCRQYGIGKEETT